MLDCKLASSTICTTIPDIFPKWDIGKLKERLNCHSESERSSRLMDKISFAEFDIVNMFWDCEGTQCWLGDLSKRMKTFVIEVRCCREMTGQVKHTQKRKHCRWSTVIKNIFHQDTVSNINVSTTGALIVILCCSSSEWPHEGSRWPLSF